MERNGLPTQSCWCTVVEVHLEEGTRLQELGAQEESTQGCQKSASLLPDLAVRLLPK